MIGTFQARNREKLWLWPGALQALGERADKRVFLIAEPSGIHVQYARIGWDSTGDRGLVYLELRPREGSESMRALFRIVHRGPAGWEVEPSRSAVDRGDPERHLQQD